MKNFQRASLACSASVIAALCLIAPASAVTFSPEAKGTQIERVSDTADIKVDLSQLSQAAISAPATAKVSFDKPVIKSTPAPPPVVEAPAPAPVVEAPAPVAAPAPQVAVAAQTNVAPAAPVAAAKAAPVVPAASAPAVAPAPAAAPAAVSASGKGAAILSAAMGQLGVNQDCTMLVTNSLKAVGINFHDWPAGYLGLGTVVPASQAQPGDLIYYANGGSGMAHIAVYAGNGKAVHGGFDGNRTVVFSANVGSGPVFIRVA